MLQHVFFVSCNICFTHTSKDYVLTFVLFVLSGVVGRSGDGARSDGVQHEEEVLWAGNRELATVSAQLGVPVHQLVAVLRPSHRCLSRSALSLSVGNWIRPCAGLEFTAGLDMAFWHQWRSKVGARPCARIPKGLLPHTGFVSAPTAMGPHALHPLYVLLLCHCLTRSKKLMNCLWKREKAT